MRELSVAEEAKARAERPMREWIVGFFMVAMFLVAGAALVFSWNVAVSAEIALKQSNDASANKVRLDILEKRIDYLEKALKEDRR